MPRLWTTRHTVVRNAPPLGGPLRSPRRLKPSRKRAPTRHPTFQPPRQRGANQDSPGEHLSSLPSTRNTPKPGSRGGGPPTAERLSASPSPSAASRRGVSLVPGARRLLGQRNAPMAIFLRDGTSRWSGDDSADHWMAIRTGRVVLSTLAWVPARPPAAARGLGAPRARHAIVGSSWVRPEQSRSATPCSRPDAA